MEPAAAELTGVMGQEAEGLEAEGREEEEGCWCHAVRMSYSAISK